MPLAQKIPYHNGDISATLGLEKKLFVSCNGTKKNRVGRSVKNEFCTIFFGQKCVFYAFFTLIMSWEGRRKFRVGIFFNKNLLGLGYRKQTIHFFRP